MALPSTLPFSYFLFAVDHNIWRYLYSLCMLLTLAVFISSISPNNFLGAFEYIYRVFYHH